MASGGIVLPFTATGLEGIEKSLASVEVRLASIDAKFGGAATAAVAKGNLIAAAAQKIAAQFLKLDDVLLSLAQKTIAAGNERRSSDRRHEA